MLFAPAASPSFVAHFPVRYYHYFYCEVPRAKKDKIKMLSNGPDFPKKMSLFHIQPDDEFFSRLVSKENSSANPSFRVYYGDLSGAVPFTWETRPGTPKHTSFSDSTSLPPLTPPPSYHTNTSHSRSTDKSTKKQPRSKLVLRSLLARMISLNRAEYLASPPSSLSSLSSLSSFRSSSHSSSFSGTITPSSFRGRRRRFSSWSSSLDDEGEDDHLQMPSGSGSPKSRFCFPARRSTISGGNDQGGNSVAVVTRKKNLLSIIGCGSG